MRFGPLALYALFYLSGASGLGLQMAWSRMFATGLGHEMPAVLAVVAAIFGGMALGAWASERGLRRQPRPGRWYGWLELLLGGWALGTIALVPWANEAALRLIGLEAAGARQWLVAFLFPCMTLLPATTAMGATFPAMERFLAPLALAGRCVGGLYAANTFGAVTGIMVSTFILVPRLGFSSALAVLAVVSLGCGATAIVVERRLHAPQRRAGEGAEFGQWPADLAESGQPNSTVQDVPLALTLGITGLLGIGYEVLGVRVLSQVLENTIYTFAAVLATYLVGTAAGAALYQLAGRRFASGTLLQPLLIGASAASLLGVWILSRAPIVYGRARTVFAPAEIGVWCAEFLTAGLVFFGPTLLMGATFSHLVQMAKQHPLGVGRAIACNTLGSAVAPLIFGVLLLPLCGAKWAFVVLGLAYIALAWPLTGWRLGFAGLPLLMILTLPSELRFVALSADDKVLAYREGTTDSVAVVAHADGNRSLIVNNHFMMGGTGAALAERRHATIPLLLHPEPKRALFLGLGTGITFAAAGIHDGLEADGVELVPEIVELLPFFAPHNTLPASQGRFRIYTADARRFVQVSPRRYDVIVADLFHPARDGAGALYSLEHFRAIRKRLTGQGLFCQWLPLYQLDEPVLRVIVRTFLEVFPETHAYLLRWTVDTPVLGLVGRTTSQRYSPDYFQNRVTDPKLLEQLTAEQIRDGYHLFGCFMAGPSALRQFAQGSAVNTDDRPVVLFAAPAFNLHGREKPYGRLLRLLELPSDLTTLIQEPSHSDGEFAASLTAFITARNQYLRGFIAEIEGNPDAAMDAYIQSVQSSPVFTTSYARALSLAMELAQTNPPAARRLLERLAQAQPNRPVAEQLLKRLSE